MSSWIVTMTGSLVDLRTIVHSDFDFQTLYPCPYRDSLGEPTDDRYHNWCMEHWGTPECARDVVMTYDEDSVTCTFVTSRWPRGLFAYLKERFPLLIVLPQVQ
jgi:hypothetical protein